VSWASPTGHVETAEWYDEAYAYDESTGSYAFYGPGSPANAWTPVPLTLLFSASLLSDKLRFWSQTSIIPGEMIWLEISNGGITWTTGYQGPWTPSAWVEAAFTQQEVDRVRIRFWLLMARVVTVNEFDFWQLPPAVVGYGYSDGLVSIQV